MKHINSLLLTLAFILVGSFAAQAQLQQPAASPAAHVSQVVGFTKISIDYSSPAVKGRKVFGNYPSLALKTTIDLGNGVLIPSLSTDAYFAELALWFGLPPSELPLIYPNINKFYSYQSGTMPIGFMGSQGSSCI
jgi:hypothetical protein